MVTSTKDKTYEYYEEFFEQCVDYWMRHGNDRAEAESRALYWDLIEASDVFYEWNPVKRKFVEEKRKTITKMPTED